MKSYPEVIAEQMKNVVTFSEERNDFFEERILEARSDEDDLHFFVLVKYTDEDGKKEFITITRPFRPRLLKNKRDRWMRGKKTMGGFMTNFRFYLEHGDVTFHIVETSGDDREWNKIRNNPSYGLKGEKVKPFVMPRFKMGNVDPKKLKELENAKKELEKAKKNNDTIPHLRAIEKVKKLENEIAQMKFGSDHHERYQKMEKEFEKHFSKLKKHFNAYLDKIV